MYKKISKYFPYVLIVILIVASIGLYIKDRSEILVDEVAEKEAVEDLEENLDLEELKKEEEKPAEDIVVHIAGAVKEPGVVKLKAGMRIIDAVEICGGHKEDADLDQVNLAQCLKDEEKVYIPYLGEEIKDSKLPEGEISDKIDINSCSKEELTGLSGIGPKTAEKILDYREKNKFESIEDIKKVSGIGDKKFEAIENEIIVK